MEIFIIVMMVRHGFSNSERKNERIITSMSVSSGCCSASDCGGDAMMEEMSRVVGFVAVL